MARNSYGIGQLNAAAPGLSKLAQALVGGQGAYQQGFQGSIEAQSKIAQTLAQVREANAAAAAHQAQADEVTAKTGVLNRRPDLFSEQVANAAGTDVPTVSAFRTSCAPARRRSCRWGRRRKRARWAPARWCCPTRRSPSSPARSSSSCRCCRTPAT
jgi:hypothetical protein